MSGIACIINFSESNKLSSEEIDKLTNSLEFRGKDFSSFLSKGNASFIQCMFNATKEDLKEELPKHSKKSNLIIVSDSRLDNRKELVKELNCQNDSVTDSELILKSFTKWGADLVDHLVGAFAFIIYDLKHNKVYAARDHMGLKPLYYRLEKERLIISSSVDSILSISLFSEIKVSRRRIIDYLLFSAGRKGDTFYDGIYKVPKASILEYSDSELSIKKYFDYSMCQELRLNSEEDYINEFKKVFFEVIESQLRNPNGRITSALSGGLDSSSITRTASELNKNNELTSISVLFKGLKEEEFKKTDELEFMIEAQDTKKFKNVFIDLENTGPISNLSIFQKYHKGPVPAINGYIHVPMFKKAKELDSRVFLDGFDGDTVVSHGSEVLYEYAKKFRLFKLISEREKIDKRYNFKTSYSWILKTYLLKPLLPKYIDFSYRYIFKRKDYPLNIFDILNKEIKKKMPKYKYIKSFFGFYPYAFLGSARKQHIGSLENPIWEFGVEMIENHALKHGIEIRFPFFDIRLVKLCISMPANIKNKNGEDRYLLRRAMKGIVPKKILERKIKSNVGSFAEREIMNYDYDLLIKELEESSLKRIIDMDYFRDDIVNSLKKGAANKTNNILRSYLVISLLQWIKEEKLSI